METTTSLKKSINIYEKIIKVYLKLVNMVMTGGQRKNELTLLIPRYLNPYI